MPAMPMMPSIQTQLMNMGIKETSVNSIRPYMISKTKNTSREVINAMLVKSALMISTNLLVRYCLSEQLHLVRFQKSCKLPVFFPAKLLQCYNGCFAGFFSNIIIQEIFSYICHGFSVCRLIIFIQQHFKIIKADALNFKAAPSLYSVPIKIAFFSVVQYCFHFSILAFLQRIGNDQRRNA